MVGVLVGGLHFLLVLVLGQTVEKLSAEGVMASLSRFVPFAAEFVKHLRFLSRDQIENLAKVRELLVQMHRVLLEQDGDFELVDHGLVAGVSPQFD